MLKINTKVDISLKQGDNSINAACSAEFELSEDITEKERQSLEQVSKLIAKTAANTINETLKSNTIQKLPSPQPMKRINRVNNGTGAGVKLASEKQISFMEFLCEKNHLDPREVSREYGNVDSLSQMEYKYCDNFIKDHHKK